jgi:hypothetical protein
MNVLIRSHGKVPLKPSVGRTVQLPLFPRSVRTSNPFFLLPFADPPWPPSLLLLLLLTLQEERRQALLGSFDRFGCNEATCAAIVDGLNLQSPATLATFTDERLSNLADQLLKYYAPRGRGAIPANAVRIPLTVLDDLKAYKKWV